MREARMTVAMKVFRSMIAGTVAGSAGERRAWNEGEGGSPEIWLYGDQWERDMLSGEWE